MLQPAQNTCLQAFRAHRIHYIARCNMLKTPACRFIGHIVYRIPHVASCSKHLPAGISDTSCTSYRMLQQTQNTCLQVYWKVGMCRRSKTILKNDGKINPFKKCDSFFATVTHVRQRAKKKAEILWVFRNSPTFCTDGVNP